MVQSAEDENYGILTHYRRDGSIFRHKQAFALAASAFAVIAVCVIFTTMHKSESEVLIQNAKTQKLYDATTFDQLSGDLLGGLEKAMDNSVDNKVRSFIAAPSLAAVPVPSVSVGYHRLLPFDPHPFVTQTQLERLLAEKRELERKREAILRTLRMRREAAAAKAAKDAAELDQVRLERAVTAAKKRQLEQAQRTARAAAAKLREAAIAKKMAIHAAAVAEDRQRELESMSLDNTKEAIHLAKSEDAHDAADDLQYQQDKSVVDSKLQQYLAQEKDLLHRIAAAEKVAAHGGQWPAEGMPTSQAAPADISSELQKASPATVIAKSSKIQQLKQTKVTPIENQVVESIVQTMKRNKRKLAQDRLQAATFQDEEAKLKAQMQSLRANDARLTKELVHAELQRSV